jgi:hypothetical protein
VFVPPTSIPITQEAALDGRPAIEDVIFHHENRI